MSIFSKHHHENCLLDPTFSYDFAIGLYLIQYTSLHIGIDYEVIVCDNQGRAENSRAPPKSRRAGPPQKPSRRASSYLSSIDSHYWFDFIK